MVSVFHLVRHSVYWELKVAYWYVCIGLLVFQHRWRLLLEEYGPKIVYIKGIHNTVADQSHGLSMTPVSIEQQKVFLQRKSRETQDAFNDKTGWQSAM